MYTMAPCSDSDMVGAQAAVEKIGHMVRETCDPVDESRSAGSPVEGQGSSGDAEPRTRKIECATRVSSQCSRVSSAHTLRRVDSAAQSEPFDGKPFDSEAELLNAEPQCSPASNIPHETQRPPRLPASCPCYLESRARFNRFMSCSLLHEYGAEVMGVSDAGLSVECSDSPPHGHEACDCSDQCWSGPIKVFTSQRRHGLDS